MPRTTGLQWSDPQTVCHVACGPREASNPRIRLLHNNGLCAVVWLLGSQQYGGLGASLSFLWCWGWAPGLCAGLARAPPLSELECDGANAALEHYTTDSPCFGLAGRS